MKEQEIKKNIAAKLGIETLNDMQRAMSDVNHPVVELIAPTGSGKTLAFALPALKAMGSPCGHPQTVIVAPSRELVLQIYEVVRQIAVGYKTVAFYGGHKMADEVNSLIMAPDIIVATPGRLTDHIRRGHLRPGVRLKSLVLDEYDKSLELGFADEMKAIMRFYMGAERIILTSATPIDEMPQYMPSVAPKVLDFKSSYAGSPRSRMHVARVESPSRDKIETLLQLLASVWKEGSRIIIFVNHREAAERVYEHLRKAHVSAGLYHGGLEQKDRENAIEMLNNGTTPVLVSTDLASRGLDIENVDAVIHYHQPTSEQAWTHRNGRTARKDATGSVYVLTTEGENIPEYVDIDADYSPTRDAEDVKISSPTATLYFNLGKREKISKGDVVGFLIAHGGLEAGEIGRINVRDHSVLVAVPRSKVKSVLEGVAHQKIKNQKVKISRLK